MSDPASSLIAALNQQDSAAIGATLNTWASYPLATIKTIASEFTANEELAAAIEKSLNAPNAGQKDDFVCRWLYQWYQLDTLETRLFVLRYIPQLLWVYLFNVANSEAPAGVEACLLCIYNVEVEQRGDGEIIFHPPTLSLPSYLHKSSLSSPSPHGQQTLHLHLQQPYDALAPPAFNAPGTAGPSSGLAGPSYGLGPSPSSSAVPALTENALRQFNKQAKQVTVEKALRPIGVVTAANRGAVVRVALQRYNNYISLIPPRSWVSYCKMCKRLVNFGFDFTITPLPLIKSKSFSKKYIEEDMDNLAIDSDEDFEYDEDDFPDEFSDSDGEKEKDVEKGAIIVQEGESAHNGKDKKSKRKHLKEPSSSNLNSSSPKIPPLNIASSSSPSPSPARSSSNNNLSSPSSPSSTSSSPPLSPKNTTSTTPRDTDNNNTTKDKGKGQNVQDGKENENEREKDKEVNINVTIPNKPPTRIVIPATCLQEMVTGLTFCIFKESYKEDAVKALRKIHLRACFDLMPEIILSANALLHLEYQDRNKNAVAAELPGKTTPRGTAIPPTTTTTTTTVNLPPS